MAIETVTTLDLGVLFTPIFKFILLLLALFGGYSIIKDLINSFHCCYKDKLEHNLVEKLTNKDVKIITVENAQEIHEINKEITIIKEELKNIKSEVNNAHNNG